VAPSVGQLKNLLIATFGLERLISRLRLFYVLCLGEYFSFSWSVNKIVW